MTNASLFPEWEAGHEPPPQKQKRPWAPGPNCRAVLDVLAFGPADDWQVFEQVVGHMTRASCTKAIDELATHGVIVDTGERGRWTAKGRLIVWKVAPLC